MRPGERSCWMRRKGGAMAEPSDEDLLALARRWLPNTKIEIAYDDLGYMLLDKVHRVTLLSVMHGPRAVEAMRAALRVLAGESGEG